MTSLNCDVCGEQIPDVETPGIWHLVEGYTPWRETGGANQIRVIHYIGRCAHGDCLKRRRREWGSSIRTAPR